jgi:CRISPR-associated protein Cas2
MPSRRLYLFSYDIADDKRRNQVFRALRDNGDHAQFSVFFCELNRRELAELESRLVEAIDQRKDQVMILDLGSSALGHTLDPKCLGVPYAPPIRARIV